MKGPPRPSTVKDPATCRGSPVATYASISASEMSPKWTCVEAERVTVAVIVRSCLWSSSDEAGARIAAEWPVHRVAVVRRMARMRSRATSGVWGLPSIWPSISSMESQPTTRTASPSGSSVLVLGVLRALQTSAHLAAASTATSSAGVVVPPENARPPGSAARTASSSTVETWMIGVMPAAMSVARRAGEAEARTRRIGTLWTIAREAWRQTEIYCKMAGFRR